MAMAGPHHHLEKLGQLTARVSGKGWNNCPNERFIKTYT
jgi:hypothetical protein